MESTGVRGWSGEGAHSGPGAEGGGGAVGDRKDFMEELPFTRKGLEEVDSALRRLVGLYFLTFSQGRFRKSQVGLVTSLSSVTTRVLSWSSKGILPLSCGWDLERALEDGTTTGADVPRLLPSAFPTLEIHHQIFPQQSGGGPRSVCVPACVPVHMCACVHVCALLRGVCVCVGRQMRRGPRPSLPHRRTSSACTGR